MPLSPKMDEVCEAMWYAKLDFALFVLPRLQTHIDDNVHVVSISGFNIIRCDRIVGIHGRVRIYVKESIR